MGSKLCRDDMGRNQTLGEEAGIDHDFRRTAARNLIRASLPQHVVMKLCSWKTERDAPALWDRG
jgi:hypothetical protein